MTEREINDIGNSIREYTEDWDSHGNTLIATAQVLNPFIVMIVVDQTKVGLCGGSVDKKTRFIKELGQKHGIDFFNRMNVTIQEDNEMKQIHFSELSNHPNAKVFDSLITNLGEFRQSWPKKIEDSHYAHLV